jgi:hypothetical protein
MQLSLMSYLKADIVHEIKHCACLLCRIHKLIIIIQKHSMFIPDLRKWLMFPLTKRFM